MKSREIELNVTIASGDSYLFPEGDLLESGKLGMNNLHRFDFGGAGTPTVKYRTYEGQTLKTLSPPVDWTSLVTWIASGVYQIEVTAAGGSVVWDLKSYKEGA